MLFNKLLLTTAMGCIALLFFCGCKPPKKQVTPVIKQYLFLGHTYSLQRNQKVDKRIEKLDKSKFDMIILGGDILLGSSANYTAINYIDSLFDLKSQNTHWTMGNHDYLNPGKITAATEKPLFYSFTKNKAVFVILDSQQNNCNYEGKQMQLIRSVVDTIKEASHLILVSHKLCWLYGNSKMKTMEWVANAGFGNDYYHTNPNDFHETIYPLLVNLEKKGIETLCLAGDIGMNAKSFYYKPKEGVEFVASGITPTQKKNDKVLLLKHDIANHQMETKFVLLDELAK